MIKVVLIVLIFLFGFIVGVLFIFNFIDLSTEPCETGKRYDGCWAQVRDGNTVDHWVCVDIQGMSFRRGLELCQHEVGHEIFAEVCEKNITKCFDITK